MLLATLRWICPGLVFCVIGAAQIGNDPSPEMSVVRMWINKAANTGDPAVWANDLMQADLAAEKLEREKAGGCCGVRCVRAGTFELRYRFNNLAGKEYYQHDLLKMIAMMHEGSKDGAEALVRLLPTGCKTISNEWTPLFRTVLGILEQKRWRDLHDLRLTEIRGEAYETWWSLSTMHAGDVLITDAQMNPIDFADGAQLARERAIEAYEILVKAHRANKDVIRRLAELRAGRDTQMRKWVCYED